ncbi:MAG: B12-binding domain-containing radical SAM protein, partial [bacterium]
PIIKKHRHFINEFKQKHPGVKTVITGDHVSFFPEEIMAECGVDYAVCGGDYDVSITKLAGWIEGKNKIPEGVYYRAEDGIKNSGPPLRHDNLDALPFIDRETTNWKIYGEAYLLRPAAYILTGRGCGRENGNEYSCETGGICTFCIWQHAFWQKKARLRTPFNVAEEIEILVKKYGVYEIFDDNESGALWSTRWLEEFLIETEKRKLKGKFRMSSNARAEDLTEKKCGLMKKTGYRLLKVGMESGNNLTLEKIGKLESIEVIKENIKRAKRYGFKILMTMMAGYPWESEEDVNRTYETAKELMLYRTHFGDSLQASIVMPYPGTPLYKQAEKEGLLTAAGKNYEKMDMEHDILKSEIDTSYWCRKMWNIHKHPVFLLKSLLSIRSPEEIDLAFRGVKSLLGHTKDY